jgi:hypothetical protein
MQTFPMQVAPLKLAASNNAARPGVQLDLPNMMGGKQKFMNSRDQECTAWDFVVHPSAVQHVAAKPALHEALVGMVSLSNAGSAWINSCSLACSKHSADTSTSAPNAAMCRQADTCCGLCSGATSVYVLVVWCMQAEEHVSGLAAVSENCK